LKSGLKNIKHKNTNMENTTNTQVSAAIAPSITSLEISELVGKRHDNVKRTIETLAKQGVILLPQTEDEQNTDTMGRPRVTQVYRFFGERGKRDSIIAVAQLSPEFTARLVDRWQELERQASVFQVPRTLKEALQLALAQEERIEQQQKTIEAQRPKVDYYDLVLQSDGTYNTGLIAKDLGTSATTLNKALHYLRVQYRQGSTWVLYAEHQNKGYTKLRTGLYADGAGRRQASAHTVWTEAGRAFVMGLFGNGKPTAAEVVREHEGNGQYGKQYGKQNNNGYERTFGMPGERAGQGAAALAAGGHGDGAW